MSDHHIGTFDIGSFDPLGRRPARARRAATSAKAAPAAAAETRPADPVANPAGEDETAALRAEVAALSKIAAAALAEAALAREIAARSTPEAVALEAERQRARHAQFVGSRFF